MIHEISRSLNPSICQLAYFLAIKTVPFTPVELFVKIKYKLGMYEIDKGIPHIASVELVNRKIQKVNL